MSLYGRFNINRGHFSFKGYMLSEELPFHTQNYAPVLTSCGIKAQRSNILKPPQGQVLRPKQNALLCSETLGLVESL